MKVDYTTVVLGSMVVAFIAAAFGRFLGARNKVTEEACIERRNMHNSLIIEKINHLVEAVKKLEHKFDKFTIG